MEHPVFMYYEIKGMYQNHRRYVSSRSDPQMRGVGITTKTLKDCKPEVRCRDPLRDKSMAPRRSVPDLHP